MEAKRFKLALAKRFTHQETAQKSLDKARLGVFRSQSGGLKLPAWGPDLTHEDVKPPTC